MDFRSSWIVGAYLALLTMSDPCRSRARWIPGGQPHAGWPVGDCRMTSSRNKYVCVSTFEGCSPVLNAATEHGGA
jgi:hypothetical protein